MSISIADAWKKLLLLEPQRFADGRGWFSETYSRRLWQEIGFDLDFVQDNQSLSRECGVVRGLHFQAPPYAQDKLVRVISGSVMDVAVDIRTGSPTFGQHITAILTAENGRQLLVPRGFAHGFCTLEPDTAVLYKVSSYYKPESEGGILWNSPSLEIPWPVTREQAVLSEKDCLLPTFCQFVSPFNYRPDDPLERMARGVLL